MSTTKGQTGAQKRRGNPATLTPWVKGQSGNPRGNPSRRKLLTEDVQALLQQPHNSEMTVRRALATVMVERALQGEFAFCREVWNRVDGPIREASEDDSGQAVVAGIRALLAGADD